MEKIESIIAYLCEKWVKELNSRNLFDRSAYILVEIVDNNLFLCLFLLSKITQKRHLFYSTVKVRYVGLASLPDKYP